MSGVKGENSLKLFGDDIDVLVEKADEIRDVMAGVPGIADLGVFQETGQPELLVSIDRTASARYGLMAADVNAAVQAAIGGLAATQILQGDRRFDFVDPLPARIPLARPKPFATSCFPLPTAISVPLGQVADVVSPRRRLHDLSRKWPPLHSVKFSVRGRDLASTIEDVQAAPRRRFICPMAITTSGPASTTACARSSAASLIVIPISLLVILGLLFTAFNSLRHALLVLADAALRR